MTAYYVLDVRQALGAVRRRFEHEQLALTGQLALAIMNSDHRGLVRLPFRGDNLVAEVADELSDKAVRCRGGDFRARIEHAASVWPPDYADDQAFHLMECRIARGRHIAAGRAAVTERKSLIGRGA